MLASRTNGRTSCGRAAPATCLGEEDQLADEEDRRLASTAGLDGAVGVRRSGDGVVDGQSCLGEHLVEGPARVGPAESDPSRVRLGDRQDVGGDSGVVGNLCGFRQIADRRRPRVDLSDREAVLAHREVEHRDGIGWLEVAPTTRCSVVRVRCVAETCFRVSRHASRVVGVPENYFDAWVAQRYEVLWPHLFDPQVVEPAVSFIADLAGDGPALELGVGTGRLALPLRRRGIRVEGIELSSAMVEQLRSQPGSADIDVTIGDFSTTKVNGTFTLAYLVRNTIMNLTTQDAQVECFLNVARHLDPGGLFVIEVIVPPWQRLPPGETVIPFDVSAAHLGFDTIDIATQNSWSHHYWFVDGETRNFSAPFRYVWPSELDLMARLAGMALRDRWSDWNREPFTSTSRSHISVWQKSV